MCAYNPGVAPMGGQFIGQGISQGLASLADGILQNAARRRQKEDASKAYAALQPLIDQIAPGAGVKLDRDTPKEAIPQIISLASQISQQKQEAPLRALQTENEKLKQQISARELEQMGSDAAALRSTAPFLDPNNTRLPTADWIVQQLKSGKPLPDLEQGPDYQRAMSAYVGGGGMDAKTLAQLGDLAAVENKNQAGRRMPIGLQQFGKDASGRPVEGLVDAQGNVRYIEPQKPASNVAEPFKIGSKTLYKVGSDILDENGQPVQATRGLDPATEMMLANVYDGTLKQTTATKNFGESAAEYEQRITSAKQKANQLAKRLNYDLPFPEIGGSGKAAPASTPSPASSAVTPRIPWIQSQPTNGGDAPTEPAKTPSGAAPKIASPYPTDEIRQEMIRRGLIN
jgi:hypothetical protein